MELTIEQLFKEVQNQFKDIDNTIASLEVREVEIKESIERLSNSPNVDSIKELSALQDELSLIPGLLTNAKVVRSNLQADTGKRLCSELSGCKQVYRLDKLTEHQDLIKDISQRLLELREKMSTLVETDQKTVSEYNGLLEQLRQYADKSGNTSIDIQKFMYGTRVINSFEERTVKFLIKGGA